MFYNYFYPANDYGEGNNLEKIRAYKFKQRKFSFMWLPWVQTLRRHPQPTLELQTLGKRRRKCP